MSEDFGTVNMKPHSSERAREIDLIRQHYRRHRESLATMTGDAPTDHLAAEYQRLIRDIDASLVKLDELEGRAAAAATPAPQPLKKTEPGRRPLVTTSPPAMRIGDDDSVSPQSRLILIVIAGLIVLGLIGWLIWRASSDERPLTRVVPVTETTETTDSISAASPPGTDSALSVEPPAQDFGVVRKGTRAARQFEVVNTTESPIKINVTRSTCRCLYYDYADVIPPNGKETLTVTVDGAKAKAGQLQESVRITAEGNRSITAAFDVNATIR